jgi:FkbM family methyltransferase
MIVPHLSTGGLPQVAVKKIELLKEEYEIKCVEWSCIAWNFVVQKNRILKLIGENNLITLNENKEEIFDLISSFSPDVLLMEEFPEFFMDDSIAKRIYADDRKYLIFETTHDSSFNPSSKRFYPDKFLFVSMFNALRFMIYDIPYEIVEYPIDSKEKNKSACIESLSLDPDFVHILNVGLFTPRKNQKYLFEIAQILSEYNIKFHFLGNQADNFKWYWEPLMEKKPENCIIWGERDDVDVFLQACDASFFASKGEKKDKELNPIAIKESIEYASPIFMFNLDVYCGKYDDIETVHYISGDAKSDAELLIEKLKLSKKEKNMDQNQETDKAQELFDIKFNPDDNKISFWYHGNDFVRCSVSIRDMTSNAPIYWFNWDLSGARGYYAIPIPVQFRVFKGDPMFRGFKLDFYIEGTENLFYSHNLIVNNSSFPNLPSINFPPFDCSYANYREFFVDEIFRDMPIDNLDVVVDIGANIGLFSKYAFFRGCKKSILVEADPRLEKNIKRILGENISDSSIFMSPIFNERIDVDFYFSEKNTTIGSLNKPNTNLADLREVDQKVTLRSIVFDDILEKTEGGRISLLKCDIQGGEYSLFSSLTDDQIRSVDYYLIEFHTGNQYDISGDPGDIIDKLERNGYDCIVVDHREGGWQETDYRAKEATIVASNKKLDLSFIKNRSVVEKEESETTNKFKIKLLHLQTTVNDDREKISRAHLSQLSKYGIEYVVHTNPIYTSLPPSHNCLRPECVSMNLFTDVETNQKGSALTPAHYGCFESFKNGILSEFSDDTDFLIVCEGDCILEVEASEFFRKLTQVCEIVEKEKIDYFSFGDVDTLEEGWRQSNIVSEIPNQNLLFITDKIIGLQCIMFPKHIKKFLFSNLLTSKWDASDIYFNVIFSDRKKGILYDRLTSQCDGVSFIDSQEKIFRKNN